MTTDYPSVQRAIEMNSDAILVAKQGVDGVLQVIQSITNQQKCTAN